jgi:hypothetical protein
MYFIIHRIVYLELHVAQFGPVGETQYAKIASISCVQMASVNKSRSSAAALSTV